MDVDKIFSLYVAFIIIYFAGAAHGFPHQGLRGNAAFSPSMPPSKMAAPPPLPIAWPPSSQPPQLPIGLPPSSQPPQLPMASPPSSQPPQLPIALPPSSQPPQLPIALPPSSRPPQLPIAWPPSSQPPQLPIALPPPSQSPQLPIASPPSSQPPQLPIALSPSQPPQLPIALPPSSQAPVPSSATPSPGIKGAYWPSSAALPPSTIPTSYFTHIFYAFLQVDATSFQIIITPPDEQLMADFTSAIHASTPPAKALLSIGGAAADPRIFPNMASNSDNRAAFIRSSIDTARKYGFDGLDLDWESPANPEEMSNFASLYKEWRAAVDQESVASAKPALLLSAAVYFAANFFLSGSIPRSYPGQAIKNYADFVSPMCYDYDGAWQPNFTGAHALLYDSTSNLSTSYGIATWKGNDVPSEKIVMGMPAYGRAWQLKDPNQHGIGAPAVGIWQQATQGVMNYSAIVEFNKEENATVVFDKATVSTYSYAGTDWIGYDDTSSVEEKVKFAKAQGLGGYFFWALGFDSNWDLARAASAAWDSSN